MADRTCPKCKLIFQYPSFLKKHLQTSVRCCISDEDIDKFFNPDKYKLLCSKCNKKFTRPESLIRHNNESKCSRNNTIPQTNIETQNNTINNIQNQTNNNITHNTIIQQTIQTIQHINPFGFEDVRTIPISEMKLILTSGENAGIHIIKAIYSKLENKNFYKPNMSRPEIAFLNEDFNLTIYKTRDFADALFDRCIVLLHHILYICKSEITLNNIKTIYDNIEHIENTIRTEIYDKKLQTIIESEVRNNNLETKNKISKYIKDIKDIPNVHNNAKTKIKNVRELSKNSNDEYKITFGDKEFNDKIGDPKLALGLSYEDIQLDMAIKRFEETIFYKYWMDRINIEQSFIETYDNGNAHIGDIINLKKRKNNIEQMLDIINMRHDKRGPGEYIDLNVGDRYTINYTANESQI
jgi:hypothetical protein